MKPWIPLVMPRFLHVLGHLSPLGPGGIWAITFFPFIISQERMSESDETHEGIHIWQQLECGVAGGLVLIPLLAALGVPWWGLLLAGVGGFLPIIGWFYWVYAATFLYWKRVARKHNTYPDLSAGEQAYYLIPFEREAYIWDGDGLGYFKERKLFAWLRISDEDILRRSEELALKLYGSYTGVHPFAKG